ncbi:MAG: peptide chain release factor N(5)-glutamine methyltransferase [Ignavibacteriales bacterium]|nr:MAG: peptide chain release factor N(5)-glutamine methyltransferase [Ignavibacteriaceae bacterium]MBW7871896.1 peptide chain release factor N(5)-glutamine methyltransferase [Ignavibacteria bacterium]MCZ2144254.1 peptide chain release factor N(5)-glutamine methyltransferase [Ignavibacteriales bacterium]OQY69618.1 MAG: protein-(glutamine-N5) methyltransferase, release factor-specific [Ignavibacteriales bacterium UTCHB3]MBV6446207.1 Release factor glutamine methyltransferase [Ignavibacteriaceae 
MATVLEILDVSSKFLDEKGIESPRLNADLMMAHVLNCRRLDLYLMFDRPLKEEELESYRNFVRRRIKFEPLQYILGYVEFFNLKLKVNPSALIPRPETELFVEIVVNENKNKENLRVLDLGTGSGNISIALAANLPGVKVTSVDISNDSLELARENAHSNGVENIEFINADMNDFLRKIATEDNPFDIIVSNPPYVSQADYDMVQEEVAQFEPPFAVTDFADGYSFHTTIISSAGSILKNDGKLYLEMAKGQEEQLRSMMKNSGFQNIEVIKDYNRIFRFIKGIKKV